MSLKVVVGWYKLQHWMKLVDLNKYLKYNWAFEVSDNS